MSVSVSEAYKSYCDARSALDDAMKDQARQESLRYYRSEQRPIDESAREDAKKLAEQMQICIRKRVPPSNDDLNKWASILLKM